MKTYICGRCKKRKNLLNEGITEIEFHTVDRFSILDTSAILINLCKKCSKDFVNFVNLNNENKKGFKIIYR